MAITDRTAKFVTLKYRFTKSLPHATVADPTVWNSLPKDMQKPEWTVTEYRQSQKTFFLFLQY